MLKALTPARNPAQNEPLEAQFGAETPIITPDFPFVLLVWNEYVNEFEMMNCRLGSNTVIEG